MHRSADGAAAAQVNQTLRASSRCKTTVSFTEKGSFIFRLLLVKNRKQEGMHTEHEL